MKSPHSKIQEIQIFCFGYLRVLYMGLPQSSFTIFKAHQNTMSYTCKYMMQTREILVATFQ